MTQTEKLHRKQLQKAAELSRAEADRVSPIERQRLRLDLTEFLMSAGVGMHYRQTESDLTHEELSTAYIPDRFVKDAVEGLKDTFAKLAEVKQFPLVLDSEPKTIHYRLYLGGPSIPFFRKVSTEPGREAAIYALFEHLERSGLTPDRVKRCPREDCRNVFVLGSHARTDRMRYCSVRCSKLMATRAYQERLAKAKKKTRRRRRSKWETVMGAKKRGRK